jgi:hypothetical protein
MSGTTPAGCDVTDTTRRVGQERWPETAVLRASGLQAEEQALIRLAADYAQSCDGDAAQQLLNLASLRRTPAWLYSVPLPPIAALAEGQSYLLHHWATHTPPGHLESERALPVWYVVTEAVKERGDEAQPNLEVVSRHICPVCGRAVTPGQFTSPQPDGGHAGCAGLWEKFGWSPIWEESHPTAGDPNTTAV